MNKRLLVSEEYCDFNGENNFILKYYLLEQEIIADGGFGICTYGIEVTKTSQKDCDGCCIHSVSFDRHATAEFIHKLARCSVTPVTLPDVVQDWVLQQEQSADEHAFARETLAC